MYETNNSSRNLEVCSGRVVIPEYSILEGTRMKKKNHNHYSLTLNFSQIVSTKMNNNLYSSGDVIFQGNILQLIRCIMLISRVFSGGPPVCETTISESGVSVEGAYRTAECAVSIIGKKPEITWYGPDQFVVQSLVTDSSVWSGIEFTVTDSMDGEKFTMISRFGDSSLPKSNDSDPGWLFTYSTPTLDVLCELQRFYFFISFLFKDPRNYLFS